MQRALMLLAFAVWSALGGQADAQLGSGNIAVFRVGTGAGSLGSASTATFLDIYDVNGTLLQTITIDATGANRLTTSGSATSEGALARSSNGLFLSFAGYDSDSGVASIVSSSAATVQRVIGTVNGAGTFTRLGGLGSDAYTGNNIRSAYYDGVNAWSAGTGPTNPTPLGGIWALGGSSPVSTTVNNTRVVNSFSNQLYFSTGAGTQGIYAVGTGTPTTGPQTATLIIATGSVSPYAFQANTAGNVVYVAADAAAGSGGGVQKWIHNGTSWSLAYTLSSPSRGLTVDWSNPSNVTLFATTTGGQLIRFTDDGTAFSTTTTIATAAPNTAFRGVDQTLLPATWTRNTFGTWVDTNTSTSGFGNQFANWSVGLADGINLAFQNVNTGASPLSISTNNNSTLSSVSSITFTNGGYGGGSGGTQYILGGNGLTLNGTAATGSGVTNNSGVTQEILLALTLGTPQTFTAANGTLQFDGFIQLGANNLTVAGASNTVINGSIQGSGGLVKTGAGTLTLTNSNSFTGDFTINQGTVLVGTQATPTGIGATIVNNGGRLQGSSQQLAELVVNSGGRVAPGSSPGSLTTVIATWNGGGIYEFEINDATGTAGVNWDHWDIVGPNNDFTINATAGNQFIIEVADPQTVANFDPLQNYSWQFASFNGTIQGAGFDPNAFNVLFGGPFAGNGTFTVSQVGNGLFLNFNANPVPEPATMLLIGAAGGLWFASRRNRRRETV